MGHWALVLSEAEVLGMEKRQGRQGRWGRFVQ
jgi:hypothetical protein